MSRPKTASHTARYGPIRCADLGDVNEGRGADCAWSFCAREPEMFEFDGAIVRELGQTATMSMRCSIPMRSLALRV